MITYDTLNLSLQNLLVDQGPSTNYTQILPQAISYAENRLYRELDLLSTRIVDNTSVTLVAGTRTATLPANFQIVEGISIFTPLGQAISSSTRNVLERTTIDFLDFFYGNESTTAQPEYFAMLTDTTIVFGASPNAAYRIEIIGTGQPTAMSSSNQTSYLGNNFQDLLIAACMIFMTGWQKDYGAQTDDSGSSQSWTTQYNALLPSAIEQTNRQKSQSPNWAPFAPTPLSTPRT